MAQKNIYALLVGIDAYRPPVPALRGCGADIDAVAAYLQSLSEVTLHLKILKDKEATKAAIVNQWQTHLTKAGAADVALFYYSGHGTREAANKVFWLSEPTHSLQSLVPIDGLTAEGGATKYNLLADKELRFLIHQLAAKNPHILTIFDCCHSGQNTRGDDDVRPRRYEPDKTIGNVLPERPWNQFIFHEAFTPEQLQNSHLATLLPEGRHIQIGACLPDESAYERVGHGVFTTQLLEVLKRSDSRITYYDLQSRIRLYIKNSFRQTPQVYAAEGAQNEVFRFFLDRTAGKGAPLYGNVFYKEGVGWRFDLGQLHGLSSLAEKVEIQSLDGKQKWMATLSSIGPADSQLLFQQEPPRDKDLRGYVKGFLSAPIKVFVKEEGAPAGLKARIERQWAEAGRNINKAAAEYEADYTLRLKSDQMAITRAENKNPVVAPIKELDEKGVEIAMYFLGQISQWEFTKNLHNPNSFLFKQFPVKVEVFQVGNDGKETLLPLLNDEVTPIYNNIKNGKPSGSIKIRLTNQYAGKLYVSLLYLSMNFEVFTGLLPQGILALDKDAAVIAWEGRPIPLSYEPEVQAFNYPASISYLKIIAGTVFFDVSRFEQAELPPPLGAAQKPSTRAGRTAPASSEDWITRLVTLKIPNPNYSDVIM